MTLIIIIFTVLWAVLLIKGDDKRRLFLFVITVLVIDSNLKFFKIPLMTTTKDVVITLSLFIIICQITVQKKYKLYEFPLKKLFCIVLVAFLIVGINTYYLSPYERITKPISEFIHCYTPFIIAFFWSKRVSIESLKRIFFYCIIYLSFWGVLNILTGVDVFNLMVGNEYSELIIADRLRIKSVFSFPFDYGFVCLVMFLFYNYFILENVAKKRSLVIPIMATTFGIFFCNCRTLIVACLISIVLLYLFLGSIKVLVKMFVAFFSIGIILYLSIPQITNILDQTITVVTGTESKQVGGSSIDMRQLQLEASLLYFSKSPIVGNGYDYFINQLGWGGKDKSQQEDGNLQGLESVAFSLLLEKGLVGIVSYLLFWGGVLIYLIKKRMKNKSLCALGISITISYLVFAFSTGELGSVPITLTFLGIIISNIVYKHEIQYSDSGL